MGLTLLVSLNNAEPNRDQEAARLGFRCPSGSLDSHCYSSGRRFFLASLAGPKTPITKTHPQLVLRRRKRPARPTRSARSPTALRFQPPPNPSKPACLR